MKLPLPPSKTSWAQVFADLPPAKQKAMLAWLGKDLDPSFLLKSWEFIARREQLPPDGNWIVWLLCAGRGFGKTRSGAEWLLEQHLNPPEDTNAPTGIIAATTEDLKRYCLRGPSGILSIAPQDFYPKYEAHNARLVWPNGTETLLFSSEKPERVRGPNLRGAWCLTGDTEISMGDDTIKKIVDIKQGDLVRTRFGVNKVLASKLTNPSAEVWRIKTASGKQLVGTGNHKVLTNRGFIAIENLEIGDIVCESIAENVGKMVTTNQTKKSYCIEESTPIILGQFQKAGLFIIRKTIIQEIWQLCHWLNTLVGTRSGIKETMIQKLNKRLKKVLHVIGTLLNPRFVFVNPAENSSNLERMPAGINPPCSAPLRVLRNIGRTDLNPNNDNANSAVNLTWPLKISAVRNVLWQLFILGGMKKNSCNARTVDLSLNQNGQMLGSAVSNVPKNTIVGQVLLEKEKLVKHEKVYDLTVEDAHEFVANGIVVHNCDELASWSYLQECWDNLEFSLRATQHPRIVITTTPKPKKLLRQIIKHQSTVLSTGSTFENKSNLAPSFLKRMKELYDGTTVGKQELYAEILDEAKGALWRRAMYQYAEPPEDLTRIVIAIDPAASNTEESAETGIVVGGKKEARAFVLEDLSGNYSPDGWARKAILAYHRLQADCIVAEKNNGGDMVESTIKMTAREMHRQGEIPSSHVKIKLVWASRGKMARAEPVAALYEQGNVYHAQSFTELENQQCSWEPDSGQKSPDRLDASVWLLTELVISGREPLHSGYSPEIMGQLMMASALGAPEDIQGGFLH